MGISIVICCYNSSQRLPETLRHLANQQVNGIEWEIVLVDNASADNSIEVAIQEWAKLGNKCPIRSISEPRQGTGYARMAGVKEASYEYILFCDDDNWLADNYIALSLEIMQRDPLIGACGGRSEAVFEDGFVPDWFEQYKAAFACGPQQPHEGYLDWNHMSMYSAGMTIRKDAVMRIINSGYEFMLTGRQGNSMKGAGEDSELVMAIRLLGYKCYYTGALSFQHYMPKGRMTWPYLKKLLYGASLSSAHLYIYADVTRYIYTGKSKYKVSWLKDILKAKYGAFLIPIKRLRDLEIVWIKLIGALKSVVTNIPHYSKYEQKIKRLYDLKHKGV